MSLIIRSQSGLDSHVCAIIGRIGSLDAGNLRVFVYARPHKHCSLGARTKMLGINGFLNRIKLVMQTVNWYRQGKTIQEVNKKDGEVTCTGDEFVRVHEYVTVNQN